MISGDSRCSEKGNLITNVYLIMNMYQRSAIIILVVFLFCISVVSGAVVIEPGEDGNGHSWSSDGSTLTITGGYEDYILSNAISGNTIVHVDVDEVTLDGNGVPITGIRGNPTLDLVNVHINEGILQKGEYSYELYGITECRNIKDSSIVVQGTGSFVSLIQAYGILELYGNLDDTTITVTGTGGFPLVTGVDSVYGEIFGGEFTVTAIGEAPCAVGVSSVYGEISGGEFIVTSTSTSHSTELRDTPADGVSFVYGEISGGEFTVTSIGKDSRATGVSSVYGEVSGGEFTVTSENKASSVADISDFGKVSGGVFTVNGQYMNFNWNER